MTEKTKEAQRLERKTNAQAALKARMRAILEDSRGWTVEGLAADLPVSTPTVWRWLNDSTTMPAWFVVVFCDMLGVEGNAVLTPPGETPSTAERKQALGQVATFLHEAGARLEKGQVPRLR